MALPFYVGSFGYPIKAAPAAGDMVLVVIFRNEEQWVVGSNWCPFMPGSSPLVMIDGLGDDAVRTVIENLRTVRKAAREAAAAQPKVELSDADRLRTGGPTPLPLAQ